MKIVVIANCQARPIASLLERLSDEIQVLEVGIVHLLKENQRENILRKCHEADYIIAQQVASNYPCEYVRTNYLKEQFGSKVISIVNLYFSGYNPELIYIRIPKFGTLRGPMGDYHIETIVSAWFQGLSPEQCKQQYYDITYNKSLYENNVNNSLNELKKREESTNIIITDYIEKNYHKTKLFHTMNHPYELLLLEYTRRICQEISMSKNLLNDVNIDNESLGLYQLPINTYIQTVVDEKVNCVDSFNGQKYTIDGDGLVKNQEKKQYKIEELIDSYYEIYHVNESIVQEWYASKYSF